MTSSVLERASKHSTVLEVIGVYLVAVAVLGTTLSELNGILGPDGYYHFRLAAVLWEDGLFSSVKALPLTVFGEDLPDHHLLWHWLLIPFTFFDDAFLGVRVAAVATGAMVPAGIALFARKMNVPWASLWALLAACAVMTLPGRFVMLRAQNIAVLLILLSCYALIKERFRLLGCVSFLFMVTYHGAVILAPIVTFYVGARWLHERKVLILPFVAAGAGGVLGLTLNPYFPASFEYLYFHTVLTLPEAGAATGGGSEWTSVPWSMLWEHAWGVHVLLFGSLATMAWRRLRYGQCLLSTESTFFLLTALLMLFMYKGANRFGEYYGPMGVIASGLLFRDILAAHGQTAGTHAPRLALAALLTGLILTHGSQNLHIIERFSVFRHDKYAVISERLNHEADSGTLVYNSAYHDFPFLYFHAPTMRYVIGLDTHYLSLANKTLYEEWLWIQQVKGDELNDPAPLIAGRFQASYAVVAKEHHGLARRLARSPHAVLLEETRYGWLFRISLNRST